MPVRKWDPETKEVYEVDTAYLLFKKSSVYVVLAEIVLHSLAVATTLGYGLLTEQTTAELIDAFSTLPLNAQNRIYLILAVAELVFPLAAYPIAMIALQRSGTVDEDDY